MSRKRSGNFTYEETQLLINQVKKYKNVIESRKTDHLTSGAKKRAWQAIEESFNSESGAHRDWKVLKSKYDNLKKVSKKKFAEEKRLHRKTGGGGVGSVNITQADLDIRDMLGKQIHGMVSEFDDDANNDHQFHLAENQETDVVEENIECETFSV